MDVTRRARPRSSPEDWCAAGLAVLRDEGVGAVTVDRLCAALGKTKGSFYHHFRDLDAYLAALVSRWEEELTAAPIRAAGEGDARRRAARLDAAVRELDHRLDVSVRAWAVRDARVRAAMERVDAQRVACLAELHGARGAADPPTLAELEYAAFVGAQHLGWLAGARADRLAGALRRALAALGGAGRAGRALSRARGRAGGRRRDAPPRR